MIHSELSHGSRELSDCARCGSAGSVQFGMCQLCLSPSPSIVEERQPPTLRLDRTAYEVVSAGTG